MPPRRYPLKPIPRITAEQIAAAKAETPEKPKRPRKPQNHYHSAAQRQLMAWATDVFNWGLAPELEWFHAIPNAGKRSVVEGGILVAEGMKKGVFDLYLPAARQGYYGFYMDLKVTKSDTPSDEQLRFQRVVTEQGYLALFFTTVAAAQNKIIWYLGLDNHPRIVRWN